MLQGVGYEVVDLGINVSSREFISAVSQHQPDVLALSALLSTTMPEMPAVIEALTDAGMRADVTVILGGAPVSAGFARRAGADGYAATAGEVPGLIRQLMRPYQEVP
jgi:5-methyltetrahydrofolate--homocysteine methyltransferase